jgi:hypothetical protein
METQSLFRRCISIIRIQKLVHPNSGTLDQAPIECFRIISKLKLVYKNEDFCFENTQELYNRTYHQTHPPSGWLFHMPRSIFIRVILVCR